MIVQFKLSGYLFAGEKFLRQNGGTIMRAAKRLPSLQGNSIVIFFPKSLFKNSYFSAVSKVAQKLGEARGVTMANLRGKFILMIFFYFRIGK